MTTKSLTEQGGPGEFNRLAKTPHRQMNQSSLSFLLSIQKVHEESYQGIKSDYYLLWIQEGAYESSKDRFGARMGRSNIDVSRKGNSGSDEVCLRAQRVYADAFTSMYHGKFTGHCQHATLNGFSSFKTKNYMVNQRGSLGSPWMRCLIHDTENYSAVNSAASCA